MAIRLTLEQLSQGVSGSHGSPLVRQHHSASKHQETRFSQDCESSPSHNGDTGAMCNTRDSARTETPPGSIECPRGSGLKIQPYGLGMGPRQHFFPVGSEFVSSVPSGGPVRHQGQHPVRKLRFPMPRPSVGGSRRQSSEMERLVFNLPVPSTETPPRPPSIPEGVHRSGHPDSRVVNMKMTQTIVLTIPILINIFWSNCL